MTRNLSPDDSGRPHGELYEAMADDDAPLERKLERALAIGRDHLGVENGHVERVVDDGTHEVVESVGPGDVAPTGATLDAAKTYCRRTVESDAPVAISHAAEGGYADDPAYLETGLECYLGAPVRVDGATYGTVCFVDREARSSTFSPADRAFVELVARLVGRELEARRHERELEEREDRLDDRERALERAEKAYETLVATAPDAILLVDAETREIVRANDAAADLTGYSTDRLVGAAQADVHPPGDAERYHRALDRATTADEPRARFEDGSPLLVRRRDGTDVPVEVSANALELDGRSFVLAVVRDVTERRERQRELRTRERAIEEAPVGVTVADADDPDLPLVYANRQFERITGYDRSTAVGRNCRFLQGPETDEASLETIREGIAECEPAVAELLNYRADGTPFWNELTLAPVEGPAGETTHFVGIQRDVTGRKRRDRLLDVLNRVLRHNLRNDVQVIESYARMIAEEVDDRPADMATTVADTAADLAALGSKARELEATTKRERPPLPRPVGDVVDAAVDAVEDRDAAVRVDGLDAGAHVPARVETALAELVENAVVHAGDAPAVTVAAERCPDHASTEGSDCVVFRVSDDGPGLPDAERRVLEQGYETKLEHGTGIGLWLVDWTVTDVGGSVDVRTDDGTTATVHVPATDDPEEGLASLSPGTLVGDRRW
ncbi:MAG: PAS domain S-box protein [Haloferacaceae archaeon]